MSDLMKIGEIARNNQLSVIEGLDEAEGALLLATAIGDLQGLMTPARCQQLARLQGSKLGFLTDRDYKPEEIRDPAIECLLRGGRWTGNEFNIIAGNCYMTLQFYERKVAELVSNLDIRLAVPVTGEGGALVGGAAEWTYEGKRHKLVLAKTEEGDFRLPVKVNKGMGVDAILGKARRKLLALIYRSVTGSTWTHDDTGTDTIQPPTLEDKRKDAHAKQSDTEAEAVVQMAVDKLPELEQIGDVKAYQSHLLELCRRDDRETRDRVLTLCEQRIEEIRGSRGQRSNGKA